MKGFFKRDLYLILPNVKFYVIFIAAMGLLMARTGMGAGFISLYVAIFAASTLMGLFNYDLLGWTGFAIATPEGRKRQVQGRYCLSTLVMLVSAAIIGGVFLLGGEKSTLLMTAILGAGMLLYVALLLPISYKFGNRSRIVMVAIIGITAGVFAAGGSIMTISGGSKAALLPQLGWAVPACGLAMALAALWVSYRISLGIMAKKEL